MDKAVSRSNAGGGSPSARLSWPQASARAEPKPRKTSSAAAAHPRTTGSAARVPTGSGSAVRIERSSAIRTCAKTCQSATTFRPRLRGQANRFDPRDRRSWNGQPNTTRCNSSRWSRSKRSRVLPSASPSPSCDVYVSKAAADSSMSSSSDPSPSGWTPHPPPQAWCGGCRRLSRGCAASARCRQLFGKRDLDNGPAGCAPARARQGPTGKRVQPDYEAKPRSRKLSTGISRQPGPASNSRRGRGCSRELRAPASR